MDGRRGQLAFEATARAKPAVSGQPQVCEALQDLEAAANAGRRPPLERLRAIDPGVRDWAAESLQVAPLRRLAKLYREQGESDAALSLLEAGHALDPGDVWTVVGLSAALEAQGDFARALSLLEGAITRSAPSASILGRAATIARRTGDTARGLAFRRRAARLETRQLSILLNELIADERAEEALAEARQALKAEFDNPELAFRCYTALRRFSKDRSEVALAADRLMASRESPDAYFWRALVHWREGKVDQALAEITLARRDCPDDERFVRYHALIALQWGHWGRDAAVLRRASRHAGNLTELSEGLERADQLLRASGGSLEQAAEDPGAFAAIRSPESVFDYAAREARTGKEERTGIAMIGSSLAAGGAERVLATCFRHISAEAKFGWAKLYLFELSSQDRKDFYLQQTGLARDGIVLLNRNAPPEGPLAWLALNKAKTAQAIFQQLEKDRPAIVHAWLEPLNVLAGLAALFAGVPRIVLHTHNMRPSDLNPDDPLSTRLRDCYRALLSRPEVSLICCADAAAKDYIAWLGLPDATKVHTLHNGFSAADFGTRFDSAERARARAALGIAPGAPVVGTAFRFAEVKQPLIWVDAAAHVFAKHPDCKFIMLGGGELHDTTKAYIAKKGLSDRFILPGLVSDVARWLSLFDVFVMSSRTEALPNVLLEAQAAGVPVVAPDVGGVAETMLDGETGFLVGEDSAPALADAVARVLADAEWRQRAGVAGPTFVGEQFGIEKMISTLSHLLSHRPGEPA